MVLNNFLAERGRKDLLGGAMTLQYYFICIPLSMVPSTVLDFVELTRRRYRRILPAGWRRLAAGTEAAAGLLGLLDSWADFLHGSSWVRSLF